MTLLSAFLRGAVCGVAISIIILEFFDGRALAAILWAGVLVATLFGTWLGWTAQRDQAIVKKRRRR